MSNPISAFMGTLQSRMFGPSTPSPQVRPSGKQGAAVYDFLGNPHYAYAPPEVVNPPVPIGSYTITGTPQFVPIQRKQELWDATSSNWFSGFSLLTRPRNSSATR